jgi:hypothetical protein
MKTDDEIRKEVLTEFDRELKDMHLAVNHDKRLYETFDRLIKSVLKQKNQK